MISGARYQRVATYSVRKPVWSCSGSAIRARPKSQIWNPTQAAKLHVPGLQGLIKQLYHSASAHAVPFAYDALLYSRGLLVTWKPQTPGEEGTGTQSSDRTQSSDLKVAGGVDEQVGGL